jgi:DNA-binding transcriptional MerR regulator
MPKSHEFSIGQLAKAAKVNVQTVRYYEREGFLKPESRTEAGYRVYSKDSLQRLTFIRHAKELGFSLKEITDLLNLRVRSFEDRIRVRKKAETKLSDVRAKIAKLKNLERTLSVLISDCAKRTVPNSCPILGKMEAE